MRRRATDGRVSEPADDLAWLTGGVLHGKYLVGRRLGEGGMGAVYLAEHVGIGRTVALKVVRPELMTDPTASERFVREARAAGGIQHRHVVNVTDFGVDSVGGRHVAYLVMEHLHGETLEHVLESRQRLPLTQVVDIVEQVCAALAAAHAKGVVHRDLKPANIWLTPDARGGFHVTLLDFGIAKLRDDTFVRRDAVPSVGAPSTIVTSPTGSTATQLGESIGTPAYMSPEQCAGDDVDRRSDIYSLGIVVYQMLAGTLPFRGDTTALLRQHFIAEIPALPAEAGVPPQAEAVVRRALAKEPEARFHSAPAFAAALRAHSSGFGESMRRALVVFAERMPELSVLGAWFAIPGLVATAVGVLLGLVLPGLVMPLLWLVLLMVPLWIATPLAMASIASIFGDLRERPFLKVTWRGVARAVIGEAHDDAALARDSRNDLALYAAWVRVAVRRYIATSRATKGSGVKNMLTFVDLFRHRGVPSAPERLETMAQVLPTRAFATMAITQFAALLLLPALAVLATLGVLLIVAVPAAKASVLLALVGGFAFTLALFLQVFIALVDVMLYDLAYAMTEA
jgi:tRNA A-37 threonylcarbamoyl transferase component Bud32